MMFPNVCFVMISVDFEEAGCPTGWYKLDKKCYTVGGQGNPQTWEGAQQQCIDGAIGNGNLATVYVAGLQCEFSFGAFFLIVCII